MTFSLNGRALEDAQEILGSKFHGIDRKLGNVVRLEEPEVLLRIALREQERLVGAALGIKPGQIEPRIGPVVATRRKDNPAAVRRPAVVTFDLFAVDFLQLAQ